MSEHDSSTSGPPAAAAPEGGADRRQYERYDASISVDYEGDEGFLFSYIQNISEMGIFIASKEPLPVGTELKVRFASRSGQPLEMGGTVTWINPYKKNGNNINPGMGVQFGEMGSEQRQEIVELVRTIAYLHRDESN